MWHRYRDNGNGITVGNVFYTWNGGVSIDGSAAGKKTRAPIVAGRRLIGHPVSGTPAQELQLVPRLAEGLAGVPRLAEVPRSPEVPRPAEVPPLAETLPRDDPDLFDAIGSLCELARAPQPQPSQSTLDHQKLPQLSVCNFSADSAQEPEFLMYVNLLDDLFQKWDDPRNRERRCLDHHDIPHFVGEGLTEWSLAQPFEFDPHAAAGAPKHCVGLEMVVEAPSVRPGAFNRRRVQLVAYPTRGPATPFQVSNYQARGSNGVQDLLLLDALDPALEGLPARMASDCLSPQNATKSM
jgi:hypothetical protein